LAGSPQGVIHSHLLQRPGCKDRSGTLSIVSAEKRCPFGVEVPDEAVALSALGFSDCCWRADRSRRNGR